MQSRPDPHHPGFDLQVAVPCPCAAARIERGRLRAVADLAEIPAGLRFKTFDNFDRDRAPRQFDAVYDWARLFNPLMRPHSLLLFSEGKGAGKTHLAAAAANYLLKRAVVLFVDAPTLFGRIFGRRRSDPGAVEELVKAMESVQLLVIDDVGQGDVGGPMAQARQEIYYRVINTRELRGLPFVATSNLADMEAFTEVLGEAAASRLFGMCGRAGVINFDGIGDFRLREFEQAQQPKGANHAD